MRTVIILILLLTGCQSSKTPVIVDGLPAPSTSTVAEHQTAMSASKTQSHVYGVFFWVGGAMTLAGIATTVFISKGLGINLIAGGIAIVITAHLLATHVMYVCVGAIAFVAGHLIPFNGIRR